MVDEDNDAQGLSPTSPCRKNGKGKDYSDDDEEEEEQEDYLNIELVREAKKYPIPIPSVCMIPSPKTNKKTMRISCGKAPRKQHAPKNTCSYLTRREFMHVPQQDLLGEWDHKLMRKEPREPTPECKPCSVVEKLWGDLDHTSREFQQAYWLFMGVVKTSKITTDMENQRRRKTSEEPATTT
jgi:hypothetical protein